MKTETLLIGDRDLAKLIGDRDLANWRPETLLIGDLAKVNTMWNPWKFTMKHESSTYQSFQQNCDM